MYGALDTSTSALIAQRTRLEISAANVANTQTLTNAAGEYDPYRRRFAVFAPGDPASGSPHGVHVAAIEIDQGPLIPRLEPGSKFADQDGYVYYPNVNSVIEIMNSLEASRAYEANISRSPANK